MQTTKNTGKVIHREPTYRELQKKCKKLGIKAVGKRAVLEARLQRHQRGELLKTDYNKAKPVKAAHTVSYREAQRYLKDCCATTPDFHTTHKRVGWSNLKAIAQELLSYDQLDQKYTKKLEQIVC